MIATRLTLDREEESLLSADWSDKGKLQRIALARLREKDELGEIPTSIRFVFYELEQMHILTKKPLRRDGKPSARKPAQNLTDAITWLRDVGLVPWDWIVDESRKVSAWRFADSVHDFVIESVERARIDRFPGVLRPVILCESRTIGGVLQRSIGEQYCVTVAPTGGQATGFLRTQVTPFVRKGVARILYVGDHDDAGDDIEANSKSVLEHATGITFDKSTWERVLLTDKQVTALKRRGVEPVEKEDNRYRDGNPHKAYEAEALGQSEVVKILRARLNQLMPVPLKDVLEREVAQRAEVVRLLSRRKPR